MSGQSDNLTRKEILDRLGAYQKRGAISHKVAEMSDLLMDESDRGVVVILGSLLEDLLLERLLQSFKGLTPAQTKNLTRAGGLLNNFDDKINLAQALGIIDDGIVEMLQTVKAMRNACAHSRLDIRFTTPELRDALSLLFKKEETVLSIRSGTGGAESSRSLANRVFFISAFMFASAVLRGLRPDAANAQTQNFIDETTAHVRREGERYRALLEKRTKPRASDPRPPPID